jgi:hypothetical protein
LTPLMPSGISKAQTTTKPVSALLALLNPFVREFFSLLVGLAEWPKRAGFVQHMSLMAIL